MEVDKATRKMVAKLVEMYLKGKIDLEIEFQETKLEDEPCVDGIDYSDSVGGSGGSSNPKFSMIHEYEANQAKAKYRIAKLEKMKKLLSIFLELLDDQSEKILRLFYKNELTIQELETRMGYAERSIKKKKREALDLLAERLDFGKKEKEVINA